MVATTNPLREGLRTELTAEPCVVVIFGATGDLTHRKLIPALYNLAVDQRLPAGVSIVAFARREFSDEQFREDALNTIREFSRQEVDQGFAESFVQSIRYVQASFEDPTGYQRLGQVCLEQDRERGSRGNRLFYLATAPAAYATILDQLSAARLV